MTPDSRRPAARAGVYRHDAMRRLLKPRSIAIVGASPTPGSFGQRTLANLSGFDGTIELVARHASIGERRCHGSVGELPASPDCVVIAVARDAVEGVVLECARKGAGGAIVYASGYAETGKPERVALQSRLSAIAREAGMPIIGPNCIGMVQCRSGAAVTFSAIPKFRPWNERAIGLVSQSGALGFALAQAAEHGTVFSNILTAGNSCDVDVADHVSFLAEDPDCRVIACVFEGMPDPTRMVEAGEIAWRANKPLLVYKLATGEQGAAAAMSHTGSLAGTQAAYRAAFERAGIVIVERYEALLEMAAFFAKAPPPSAGGVAVVATSGGAAILAADVAEVHGVALPQPGDAARAVLEARVPEFGSPRNPCDVTGQVLNDPESLAECGRALMSDPAFGALVVPQVYAYGPSAERLAVLDAFAREHGKPVCIAWLTEWLEGTGASEAEGLPGLALFRSMDRCFATLAAWHRREARHARWREANAASGARAAGGPGGAAPGRAARRSPASAREAAAALIDSSTSDTITESLAKKVLAAYGVDVVQERLVADERAAVDAAQALGYPVALKVESSRIAHKTEAGVVALALGNSEAVRAAYRRIVANAAVAVPGERVDAVLVQPMVGVGVEIIVGARNDALFGPLVVVGLGGVLVELLRDTAVALAPVGHEEALAMLRRLKGARALGGFRGAAAVDLDRLADAVVRISELAADQAQRLAEIDVNPLICEGARVLAVDALLVRRAAAAARSN